MMENCGLMNSKPQTITTSSPYSMTEVKFCTNWICPIREGCKLSGGKPNEDGMIETPQPHALFQPEFRRKKGKVRRVCKYHD